MKLHDKEVTHLEVVNDVMLSVGLDNKMVKYDFRDSQVSGVYKNKSAITAIRVILPPENDEKYLEYPN